MNKAQIELFLDGSPHAVVGASEDRSKYGNKVLRAYLQNGLDAVPINPKVDEVEGVTAAAETKNKVLPPCGGGFRWGVLRKPARLSSFGATFAAL